MTESWKIVLDKNIDKLYDPKRKYDKNVKYIDENLDPCERADAVCQLVWGDDGSLLYVELEDEPANNA